ncbi:ATP-binding protein [Candidatus Pacearchaeota archaeon]|nr:ATP-binding protein [Candidatus Pacearchaeota archaeon]
MINKDKWASLIKDFYELELPESFEREIKIPLEKPINRSVSIIGPRRAGKTYLMFNLIKKLLDKGIDKEKILYINFEKAGLLPLDSNNLVSMKETFYELNPNLKQKQTWFFLDEIQNVSNWEIFVRTCLDEGINVFISGSSSKMLSKDISTSMRGRTLTYTVFPFSFREYLLFKEIKLKKYFSSSEKSKIINLFKKYLYDGGYPEQIIYNEEKEKILSNIYETTLFKDVIERENVRNIPVIKQLIKALISSKEFSVNKFYNYLKSLNLKVSKNSLYNYVGYLEDAFFVFLLKKFDLSYKKAEQSLPKVYFIDNGVLNVNGIDDKGRLLENLVFLELMRRGKDVSYYQNVLHEEVDFVLKKGKKVGELIQVCYDFENFTTKEREFKILVKASDEFNCDNLTLISMDKEGEESYKNKKIKFVPVWKWCLRGENE